MLFKRFFEGLSARWNRESVKNFLLQLIQDPPHETNTFPGVQGFERYIAAPTDRMVSKELAQPGGRPIDRRELWRAIGVIVAEICTLDQVVGRLKQVSRKIFRLEKFLIQYSAKCNKIS